MNAMIAAEILAGNRRRSRRASPLRSMAYGAGSVAEAADRTRHASRPPLVVCPAAYSRSASAIDSAIRGWTTSCTPDCAEVLTSPSGHTTIYIGHTNHCDAYHPSTPTGKEGNR